MKLRALLPRSGPAPAAPPPAAAPVSLRRQLATFGLDLAAPAAIYYLLRALGVSNLVALGAGAVVPAAGVLYQLAVRRHTDGVGLVVVATVAATIIMSVATRNPRFLLARDGLTTALWGVWFIASVAARRPAAFILARPLMEGRRVFAAGSWEALWQTEPRFRRIWRVASVMWGAGMLVDAAVRVVMSYTLPIHVVPGLGLPLWAATFVVIQIVTNTYYNAAGLYRILGARWIRARQARRGGHLTPATPGRPAAERRPDGRSFPTEDSFSCP